MPLSDHEQRLLQQIEQNLYADDPKFASTVKATDLRTHVRRRLVRAGALFALGFVVLIVGIFTDLFLVLAMVGFVLMLCAALYATSARRAPRAGPSGGGPRRGRRGRPGPGGGSRGPSAGPAGPNGGVVDRMEDRWKRRWEQERGSD